MTHTCLSGLSVSLKCEMWLVCERTVRLEDCIQVALSPSCVVPLWKYEYKVLLLVNWDQFVYY